MDGERIARRSVAFFLIKSGVNFLAVAVIGAVMALGLAGPSLIAMADGGFPRCWRRSASPSSPCSRASAGEPPGPDASRARRWLSATRKAVIDGTREALRILRSGDLRVILGAIGYWAFDNAVLWATLHAVGLSPR